MIGTATGTNFTANSYLKKYQLSSNYSLEKTGVAESTTTTTFGGDRVTLAFRNEAAVTYNRSLTVDGLAKSNYELLRGVVLNTFKDQGMDTTFQAGDSEINLETLTPGQAQDLIAEDGYFGVEKTSDRIVQMAIGIAGGDPTRLDAIKKGVEQGFQEAYDAMGGWLPEISQQTYDTVMNKLDDWAEQT